MEGVNPFIERLGITGEKVTEKLEKMGVKEADAISKEFVELTEKAIKTESDVLFISAVVRKAFPETIDKFVESLELKTFRNSPELNQIITLLKNKNIPTEELVKIIKQTSGADMSLEAVQIWRDSKMGTPTEITQLPKPVPVAHPKDVVVNVNTSTSLSSAPIVATIGADASKELDKILSDINNQNLNVTEAQLDKTLFDIKNKLVEEENRLKIALNNQKIEAARLENEKTAIGNDRLRQDNRHAELMQEMERTKKQMDNNHTMQQRAQDLTIQKETFFQNQNQIRQEMNLSKREREQNLDLSNKERTQDLDYNAKRNDQNLRKGEAETQTTETKEKVEKLKYRKDYIKSIAWLIGGLALGGTAMAVFFSRPAAVKVHEVIKTGAQNTGVLIVGDSTKTQPTPPTPTPTPKPNTQGALDNM